MMKFEQAIEILAAFEREEVRYVLIGSIAMAAHGIIRATRDVDFFVAPEPANVERIKRALRAVFDDDSIDDIGTDDLAGPYPVIRYGPPEGDFVIDLVARLGDAFKFDDIDSEELVVEGVTVRVATPRMLYRMKRDTLRPQDQVDAENLRSTFGLSEEK
jgi:nucleotidyltransferase AbiEii toxin of type IV toxin-antitoxin system